METMSCVGASVSQKAFRRNMYLHSHNSTRMFCVRSNLVLLACLSCFSLNNSLLHLSRQNLRTWQMLKGADGSVQTKSWFEIEDILKLSEPVEERHEVDLRKIGRGNSNSKSLVRLFDADDEFEPEITLYRDSAGK